MRVNCVRGVPLIVQDQTKSLWSAGLAPDLISGPCDAGIQVGNSFFDTQSLNNEAGEIRPRCVLRQFVDKLARLFFNGCRIRHECSISESYHTPHGTIPEPLQL